MYPATFPQPSSSTLPQLFSSNLPQPSSSTLPQPSSSTLPQPSSSTLPQPSSSTLPQPSSSTLPQPSSSSSATQCSNQLVCILQWQSLFHLGALGAARGNHLVRLSVPFDTPTQCTMEVYITSTLPKQFLTSCSQVPVTLLYHILQYTPKCYLYRVAKKYGLPTIYHSACSLLKFVVIMVYCNGDANLATLGHH